ncbi:hypothetical protein B0O99DRAFT_608721 [Bisporella sp. PMI_857]|nr:hypothetical protein B0O99DRAFT_608721 [Bisporella sp. PMI_857]
MKGKPDLSILPKNWPSGLPYMAIQKLSTDLDPIQIAALRTRPKDAVDTSSMPRGPCALVKIAPISIPSHPAYGQAGLFAAKDLKPGAFILQYIGEVHAPSLSSPTKPNRHTDSDYDLSLDREHGIGIDAAMAGNEARFINDYRGIGDKPNAEFREIWDMKKGERGMGVWALKVGKSGKGKGIRKGQEILVSYGKGFWGARKGAEDSIET